jgi:acetoacetyl-CoA synthetase
LREGELLWTPPPDRFADSQLARFTGWLEDRQGKTFRDYEALWRWSVGDLEGFWGSIWRYFDVLSDSPYRQVVSGANMLESRWFEGSRVNYAEHALRHEALAGPTEVAFRHCSELRPWASLTWEKLGAQVRCLASHLRFIGIQPGDRIVSYMPNISETTVAMLATTAVGAIWSAAAPEFGVRAVIERFGQIAPKLAFVADGYSFNGKRFDRREEIAQIVRDLPSLEQLVWCQYAGFDFAPPAGIPVHDFAALTAGPRIAREDFRYTRVPFDHPLWILYSSGTTGIPKAITHSHVGMVAEHLKIKSLHLNLSPASRNFFYTTTGWMMWNSVLSSLLVGSSAVLYDGSPVFGGIDALWRIASEGGATVFGASPTLVQTMKAAAVKPAQNFDLSQLDTVIVGGAPATPDVYAWFYTDVRPDLWVVSMSGGTELCSALVGGVPGLPVYAGEIQGRQLGMDVHVWSDAATEVIDSVGELVVTRPFPSQPLFFWGDAGSRRYRESYFDTFPGVWRHGDLLKINSRGGCFIYGRSDSTLNRFGVRIGSAEIYRVLAQLPEVADSLIVCCELRDGGYYMPLFITFKPGYEWNEALQAAIVHRLREDASPRHVPDEIHPAPAIPYTLTGKKMEVPIRKLLMGVAPAQAASRDAMSDPTALDWFIAFAARPEVAARRTR